MAVFFSGSEYIPSLGRVMTADNVNSIWWGQGVLRVKDLALLQVEVAGKL